MRLLLAEDEKMLSEALVTILTRNSYLVDAVYNGEDALDYLQTDQYDGAILDIMMPKMDGLTVLRQLRASGRHVPVLLLTAKSEVDDRVEGLDSGADDYLTKPFAMKELLARVRALVRRQPEFQDDALTFGSLTLRRSDSTLIGPAGSARLAGKEFQMMELLMVNHNRTISTERFMEKIWGYDSEAEINVVWVNISALRRRIAQTGANVQIRALRGVGYCLEEIK